MSGVAGRSGVPTRPEHWEARARGGRIAHENRKQRRAEFLAARAESQPEDPTIPPEDLDSADLSGDAIPRPSTDLADYPDGEGERQLAWARHWTAQRALQGFLIERGKAITAEAQGERERAYDELLLAELATLAEFCASLVSVDQKDSARLKAKEWLSALRERLAKEAGK